MRGVYTFTTESIIFHQTSLPPSLTAPPCVYLSFLCVAPPSLSRLPHAVQRASYHRGPAVSIWWRHWWGKPGGGWRGKRPSAKNTAFHTHTHTCARTHTPLPNRLLQPAAEATPEWIPVSPFFFFFPAPITTNVLCGGCRSKKKQRKSSWTRWRPRSVSFSLEHSHFQMYKSAVSVKWPRAKQRWVRQRLIRARQRLIKCSCCRPELWSCHLTPLQPAQ